jgi:hypothetical protein
LDDPALVCRRQRIGNLSRDRPRAGERHAAWCLGRDDVGKRPAVDELHHQRAYAARVLEAVDLRDVRVIEGREHLRLALDSVDLAHPTRPDGGKDLVNAQTGTGTEDHVSVAELISGAIRTSFPHDPRYSAGLRGDSAQRLRRR